LNYLTDELRKIEMVIESKELYRNFNIRERMERLTDENPSDFTESYIENLTEQIDQLELELQELNKKRDDIFDQMIESLIVKY
jgi:flagellar biosynthesis chaperone FliJ